MSNVDVTKPVTGTPTTSSVRDNFTTIKTELEAFQETTLGGSNGFKLVYYQLSQAESDAGVTPTKYYYNYGDVRRYGATGDGVTDDTTAIDNAILVCKANTFSTMYIPIGTYVITSALTQLNTSFDCITVQGENAEETILDITALGSEVAGLLTVGGSGGLCKSFIADITILGDGAQAGIENRGLSGFSWYRCKFSNLKYGNIWSNDDVSGTFTEYSVAYECDYDVDVETPFYYKRGAGNDSFHGSGFKGATVNNGTGETAPTIQVGDPGGESGRLIVYNAPWDGQIWNRNTRDVINIETSLSTIIMTYGQLNIEILSGTPTLGAGENIYYTGNLMVWSVPYLHGTFLLCDEVFINSDSSINAIRKPYNNYDTNSSGTTITLGVADELGALWTVHFVGTNYDFKYIIAAEKDNYGGAGATVTVATLNTFDVAAWGAPSFSVDTSGNIIATNANWSGQSVEYKGRYMGGGGRQGNFSNGY